MGAAWTHWLPRFSLRRLLVGVTAISLYMACWLPTVRRGGHDVGERICIENHWENGPMLIKAEIPLVLTWSFAHVEDGPGKTRQLVVTTSRYFWFFGLVTKLPFSTKTIGPLRFKNGTIQGFNPPPDGIPDVILIQSIGQT